MRELPKSRLYVLSVPHALLSPAPLTPPPVMQNILCVAESSTAINVHALQKAFWSYGQKPASMVEYAQLMRLYHRLCGKMDCLPDNAKDHARMFTQHARSLVTATAPLVGPVLRRDPEVQGKLVFHYYSILEHVPADSEAAVTCKCIYHVHTLLME